MRPLWESVPGNVRSAVEDVIGFAVVRAESQAGGFSPGVASRVYGASGERAFVKVASAEVNADTLVLHRREARIAALLPASVGAPRLLGSHDDGIWVALAFEQVDGRAPHLPWREGELTAALEALDRLSKEPAPLGVPSFAEDSAEQFDGWRQLAANPSADLSAWERRHLDELAAMEAGWREAADGDRLVHLDVRDDNLLVAQDGTVVLVDWPWAQRGNPVFDVVAFAPSVALGGGPDPEPLLQRTAAGREADPEAVTTLVCAVAGLWEAASRQPAPLGWT
jgi:aminoglycoside phosphotransferase (APT) family kinase protein